MKKFTFHIIFFTILFFSSIDVLSAKEIGTKNRSDVIPGIVVAKIKPGTTIQTIAQATQSSAIAKISQVFPHHSITSGLSRIYYIYIDSHLNPFEVAVELSTNKIFEYVEPRYMSYITETIPNDTLIGGLFYLSRINMFKAWDIEQGSSKIIIAIVDNGTDYNHPDLVENIWTNPAELQGKPGIDDDGNGYIDDFHGWDFGNNDNDPIFGTDAGNITSHGTHTAGIASAVTNNITGVAGVGWNCEIMPVKASEDDVTRFVPFGYEGIVYAADNGALVINNSWGRSGAFSQYEQDIINYAVTKGCIIVGAAGNSNRDEMFYPAGYVHVIAVAAVNEFDQKASYSNFGKFIDISAPGGDGFVKILNTFPVERGSYGEMSGTSMASPVVAGVMGLLRNHFPDANHYELSRRIILTADNIDAANPEFIGLLGYGRVNAFGALTEDIQEEEPPRIVFFKAATNDSIWGDGNFLFERDETIGIDAWYRNFSISPGKNFVVTLSSDDEELIITNNRVSLIEIPADSIFRLPDQLRFRIEPDASPHSIQLVLNYSINNREGGSDTLCSFIGKSSVLLVDDDNGQRNMEDYYTAILDQLSIPYLRWDHFSMGTPRFEILRHFPTVIWFCEWAFPSLEPRDRTAIQQFLNHGGKLFISGQDIGWDLADPASENYSEQAVRFFQDYLHAEYRDDNSRSSEVIGLPGTIGQGMKFYIFQPRIGAHLQFPEWIEPTEPAKSCFRYDNGKGAGVVSTNSSKVLYLGFGFEAVDASSLEDPFRMSRARLELMERIVTEFGPLSHKTLLDIEQANNPVLFQVQLSPLVNDLLDLALFWKTDSMSGFSKVELKANGNHEFESQLDLASYRGMVSYYFQLTTPYYRLNLPVAGANKPYSFHIGRDTIPPRLFHIPAPDIFTQINGRTISVYATDNLAVDSNSVWLHYQIRSEQDSLQMNRVDGQWFAALLPATGILGDSLSYYFSATDLAQLPNRSESKIFSYRIGVEGFEQGLDFWTVDSIGWQIDDQKFHSGNYCVSTFPGQGYENNLNISLQTKFGLHRNELKDRALTFWTSYELEAGKDFGYVEVSENNGKSWQALSTPISGESKSWGRISLGLDQFYRETDDTMLIRFRLQSDSAQTEPLMGWFIDDIMLHKIGTLQVSNTTDNVNSCFSGIWIESNAPNPFNAATRINYQLSLPGEVRLEIYNITGQLVMKKTIGLLTAGQHSVTWNGKDRRGNLCNSGIYFARLFVRTFGAMASKRYSPTVKLIYVR